MRPWEAFKAWITGVAEKRRLDIRESFRRLPAWARCLLVVGWIAILWKFFAPVIAMNVAPHYAHAIGPDWSVNWCTGIKKTIIEGKPDPKHISTSRVERSNLTVRMHNRRFTRLTNGFSKKLENHAYSVALFVMYYNFCNLARHACDAGRRFRAPLGCCGYRETC
jgi:hypothetical protein